MGHWSYLIGCGSRADAERRAVQTPDDIPGAAPDPLGPEFAAKYKIPLFWLAAFDPSDLLTVRRPFEDGDFLDFVVLWTPVTKAVDRLLARRRRVLDLIGREPGDADFYDDWVDLVARSYLEAILLQPEDVLAMEGDDEEGALLLAALKELSGAKSGCNGIEFLGALSLEPRPQDAVCTPEQAELFRRAALTGYSLSNVLDWPPGADAEAAAHVAAPRLKPAVSSGPPADLAPAGPESYAIRASFKSGWKFWT